MKYKFWKYQGTGNDFVIFDGRHDLGNLKGNQTLIARICHRKFGVGADGLIIIEPDSEKDFRMVYYNSDGADSSMCGNGGRCSIAFAHFIGFSEVKTEFEAVDGAHHGIIDEKGIVSLGMSDVSEIIRLDEKAYFLDTGSPHFVYFKSEDEKIDIYEFGQSIRYSDQFKVDGVNVNVVSIEENGIYVETYERGVENETLSCGTGVTACAIAYNEHIMKDEKGSVPIRTKGGDLSVNFQTNGEQYSDVVLSGPVKMVFEGEISY